MNSYTTVSDVRRTLGNLFSYDDVIPYISQATERMVNGGLFKGMIGYAAFPSVNNYFTLPYPFLSVIGADWFLCPVPVFGQFHIFTPGGPGIPLENQPPSGIIEDLGDGYATMIDPPTAGSTLVLQPDLLIDNGKTFRFYGISNGKEIFDVHGAGMNIELDYPASSENTVFDVVTGIQVPVNADGSSAMVGGWTLFALAPDGTQTQLSYYYPNETRPQYRRYSIGVTSSTNTQVPNAVTVLVRRRWMPVAKETDWVFPGNIGALKKAMQAIDSEASKNDDVAEPLWTQAYGILNQELHATRGAARPQMTNILGGMGGFANVH